WNRMYQNRLPPDTSVTDQSPRAWGLGVGVGVGVGVTRIVSPMNPVVGETCVTPRDTSSRQRSGRGPSTARRYRGTSLESLPTNAFPVIQYEWLRVSWCLG